jgi:hypothetical protein
MKRTIMAAATGIALVLLAVTASVDPGGHSLTFVFHTFSGIDGINYYIDGGSYETVNLQRDGGQLSVDNIFLGEDSVHPDNNPFRDVR